MTAMNAPFGCCGIATSGFSEVRNLCPFSVLRSSESASSGKSTS